MALYDIDPDEGAVAIREESLTRLEDDEQITFVEWLEVTEVNTVAVVTASSAAAEAERESGEESDA